MAKWVKVTTLTELQPGHAKTCTVAGKEFGLYNVEGKQERECKAE